MTTASRPHRLGAWFILIGAVLTIAPAHLRRWAAWAMFLAVIAIGAAAWVLARCVSHYTTAHSLWTTAAPSSRSGTGPPHC